MFDLAQNLMASAQKSRIEGSAGVLGQRVRSQKSPFRIGLWPIVSSSEPEVAMGVGLVFAALLESHPAIRVYRLLAQVDQYPDSYEWELNDSQFRVDDWEMEGLDENVAIWGSFEVVNGIYHFSIEVENDALEDDITFKSDYETKSLVELINLLPSIGDKIASWLDSSLVDSSKDQYELVASDDANLVQEFVSQIFYWELDYFLELWGQPADQKSVLSDLDDIVSTTEQMKCNFGAWILAQTISRLMMFDETNWSQLLIPRIKEITDTLATHPVVAATLAVTLFRLDSTLEAFDLLENALLVHPQSSVLWNLLGALYAESREDLAAVDVYQRAIEAEAATSETYLRYANIINLLRERQIELGSGNRQVSPAGRPFVDRYIFVDSDEVSVNLREAATAYQRSFELDSSNLDALTQLVPILVTLHDDDAWEYCQTLVDLDKEGGITASIIEQLDDDDLGLIIDILRKSLANNPLKLSIRINLARAYLALGENTKAKLELDTVSRNNIPLEMQSTISRLRLASSYPDFENRLGEINDILQANGKVSAADTEFLEEIIENEPSFSDGYKLLAESYLSWREPDDALEVLLDAQNNASFDAEVIALLSKVLWDADQPDLAFAYLTKGLEQDNRNATLLSLNGRFLFDNGQDEEAKEYLLRAEEVDPSNSELVATRLYIANILIETKKE